TAHPRRERRLPGAAGAAERETLCLHLRLPRCVVVIRCKLASNHANRYTGDTMRPQGGAGVIKPRAFSTVERLQKGGVSPRAKISGLRDLGATTSRCYDQGR